MMNPIMTSWLLLLSTVGMATAQYPIGEPMSEPEPEPHDTELVSAVRDVLDVMNEGGYAEAAISETGGEQFVWNHTHHNVTFPMYGQDVRRFQVDVTILNSSWFDEDEFGVRSVMLGKTRISLEPTSTRRDHEPSYFAISELHSMNTRMFGKVKVIGEFPKSENSGNVENCEPMAEVTYHYLIPGSVAAISAHTFEKLPNVTDATATLLSGGHVRPYNGTMTYSVDLSGHYVPIMKTLAQQPGSVSGWYWRCGRWEQDKGRWNTDGCYVIGGNNTSSVTCRCEENGEVPPSAVYTLLLGVGRHSGVTKHVIAMCIAFEAISVVSLLVALIILLALRGSLRASADNSVSNTTTVHINLCLALVLLHVVVLLRPAAVLYELSCEVVAVLTHYFLIVSGAWMLVEGVTLYRTTCGSAFYHGCSKKRWVHVAIYVVLAWLVPAIVVGFCAGFGLTAGTYMDNSKGYKLMTSLRELIAPSPGELSDNSSPRYAKYSLCWLNPTTTYAAAVPIALMLLPNVVIAFIVCVRVGKIKRLEDKKVFRLQNPPTWKRRVVTSVSSNLSVTVERRSKPVVASLRAFLILLPVLGVPWIGTFVGVVPAAETTITALHLLASSMQGLLVAVIVCFLNREVRRILRRKLRSKFSCYSKSNKVSFVSTSSRVI